MPNPFTFPIRRLLRGAVLAVALAAAAVSPARAVNPDEMLRDPAQEARARRLSAELRCLQCQNQSIDDSDAPFSHEIRVLLREKIAVGKTDDEILDFLTDRYGQFVRLKPQFNLVTAVLWLGPFAVLGGGAALLLTRRRRRSDELYLLTEEEENRLEHLLEDIDKGGSGGRPA
jgi:cytochrome c-type biogenesis protein CcmH